MRARAISRVVPVVAREDCIRENDDTASVFRERRTSIGFPASGGHGLIEAHLTVVVNCSGDTCVSVDRAFVSVLASVGSFNLLLIAL